MSREDLDFYGCFTITDDPYYDIKNGYYDDEIKCKSTLSKLKEALEVIKALENHLADKDLIV